MVKIPAKYEPNLKALPPLLDKELEKARQDSIMVQRHLNAKAKESQKRLQKIVDSM